MSFLGLKSIGSETARKGALGVLLAGALVTGGCGNALEGGLAGAGLGAGGGAIIGSLFGSAGLGAAAGAVGGALIGGVLGDQNERNARNAAARSYNDGGYRSYTTTRTYERSYDRPHDRYERREYERDYDRYERRTYERRTYERYED